MPEIEHLQFAHVFSRSLQKERARWLKPYNLFWMALSYFTLKIHNESWQFAYVKVIVLNFKHELCRTKQQDLHSRYRYDTPFTFSIYTGKGKKLLNLHAFQQQQQQQPNK